MCLGTKWVGAIAQATQVPQLGTFSPNSSGGVSLQLSRAFCKRARCRDANRPGPGLCFCGAAMCAALQLTHLHLVCRTASAQTAKLSAVAIASAVSLSKDLVADALMAITRSAAGACWAMVSWQTLFTGRGLGCVLG